MENVNPVYFRNRWLLRVILAAALACVTDLRAAIQTSSPSTPSLLNIQDFQNTPPLQVQVPAPRLVQTNARPTISMPAPKRPLAPGLREGLKGIVILGSLDQFKKQGVTGVHGLEIKGPPFLKGHQAMLSVWVGDFLGTNLTLDVLSNLQTYLIRACRQLDRPVVDVYYPQQEVVDGIVQIVILEGRVGGVKVDHRLKWFSEAYLTNHIHFHPGDSISQTKLLHDVAELNRDTQFLEVNAFYKQADFNETNAGLTDIGLSVKERFPLRVFAGYDNYGLKVLGENQVFAGFNYGNVFGVMDQLNYQYTTDVEFASLQSHTASFVEPLPWGHTLTLFGGYNWVTADLDRIGLSSALRNSGYTYQIGLRYLVPLPHWWNLDHDISVGYDFKSADTAIAFGQLNVTPFAADVDQVALGYRARKSEGAIGYSQINLNGYYSPGGLLGRNTDANFASFHAGLKADYYYGKADAEQGFYLPGMLLLRLRGGYQDSSTGLLPSEEFYLGGNAMLRGYPEDIISGDQGYYGSVELHSPLISMGNLTRAKNIPGMTEGLPKDALDIFAFYDYGAVDGITPNVHNFLTLDSFGGGLSYHISQNLKTDFSYGFQLQHLPSSTPESLSKAHSRAHISATLAF